MHYETLIIYVMNTSKIERHIGNFNIAGFTYWDGCIALDKLRIGARLRLERESENRFDPYAVAIYFGEYKLGYIPEGSNRVVSQLMDLGYGEIFDMRVQRLQLDAHPEKQVSVVLFVNPAHKVFNRCK